MACLAREPSTFAGAHGVCVLPAARPQIEQQQQHFKNIAHAACWRVHLLGQVEGVGGGGGTLGTVLAQSRREAANVNCI